MSDGFTDGYRDQLRERQRQEKIDAFFEAVIDHASGRESVSGLYDRFLDYDRLLYSDKLSFAESRYGKRRQALEGRLEIIRHRPQDSRGVWAELLTEALMEASPTCFFRLSWISPFHGRPIVVIVPNPMTVGPTLLGDFRETCDLMADGLCPFTHTVFMPERSVRGIRRTETGFTEIIEPGWDDVRFISF